MSETFVEAAAKLCAAAADLHSSAGVMLHREQGPLALTLDNMPGVTDEMRLFGLTDEAWERNPVFVALRRRLSVLGPEMIDASVFLEHETARGYSSSRDPQLFAVPLLAPSGWFGTVLYFAETTPGRDLERELVVLATRLSVWCTDRGIARVPDVRPLARRQHQVATLAASGRTNPEIADALGISVNTVKLRLKQAYERLGVDSRAALGALLRRLSPLDGVAPGLTHCDGYTITRYR